MAKLLATLTAFVFLSGAAKANEQQACLPAAAAALAKAVPGAKDKGCGKAEFRARTQDGDLLYFQLCAKKKRCNNWVKLHAKGCAPARAVWSTEGNCGAAME